MAPSNFRTTLRGELGPGWLRWHDGISSSGAKASRRKNAPRPATMP